MYEAAFRNIDNTLREDAGCGSELDYIEQTSWMLFLKYLDDFEAEKFVKVYHHFYDAEWDGEPMGPIEGETPVRFVRETPGTQKWLV